MESYLIAKSFNERIMPVTINDIQNDYDVISLNFNNSIDTMK